MLNRRSRSLPKTFHGYVIHLNRKKFHFKLVLRCGGSSKLSRWIIVLKREFSQANFRRFLRNVTARQTSFRSVRQECCRRQTENNEKYFIDMLLLFCCALVVPSCRQKNDNKSRLPSHEAQVAMLKVETYEIVCLIVPKCSHLMGSGCQQMCRWCLLGRNCQK